MADPAILAAKAINNRPKIKVGPTAGTLLLASGLGIGTFFLVRGLVRKFKRNTRERKALNPGAAENYVLRLILAFENANSIGWGTDEEALFRTLEENHSAAVMRKVIKAYPDLDKSRRNLAAVLKSELTSREFAIANEIINSKT